MKIVFQPTIVVQALTDAQRWRILDSAVGATLVEPTDKADLLAQSADAEVFLGNMSRDQFNVATRLRYFCALSSGVDRHMYPEFINSDVTLTSEKGIVGTHLSEHGFGLLLSLSRQIATVIRQPTAKIQMQLRRGAFELYGKTMGVVGLGGTGRSMADKAAAFGMRVIAVDPEPVQRPSNVEWLGKLDRFHELLGESDVVAICAPLCPSSRQMFNDAAFAAMKRTALLINVTRGEIVEETALLKALRAGAIGGAGLDVTPIEPLPDDHPLWNLPNVVITPHTAGASDLRADRAIDRFCRNIRNLQNGEPLEGIIDKVKGY